MNKTVIIAILAGVLFFAGGVSGYFYAKRASDRGIIAQQKKDAKAVLEISKKEKVRIKYVERIKTVIREIPTDDCIDRPLPKEFIQTLKKGYSTP